MSLCVRAPISKHPLLRPLLATFVLALVAGCGSGNLSGSDVNAAIVYIQCANPGGGLAAVDLSGQCRVAPQATMGALEAVGG